MSSAEGILTRWERPYFKKSETFQPPPEEASNEHFTAHDTSFLGTSGPIAASYNREYNISHTYFHETLNSLGAETNKSHSSGNNLGPWTSINSVNIHNGTRSYSVDYCKNHESAQRNLHILTKAYVQEIVLVRTPEDESWVASGVRFKHDGKEYTVKTRREVILSAGSVQSPQLLEKSGIGRPDVLAAAGIPLKVDSRNVGENLQDHSGKSQLVCSCICVASIKRGTALAIIYEVDPSVPYQDDQWHDPEVAEAARKLYQTNLSGPMTRTSTSYCYLPFSLTIPSQALQDIATRMKNLEGLPSEQASILNRRLGPNSEETVGQIEYVLWLAASSPTFQPEPPSSGKRYASLSMILQYPLTRGSIHTRPRSSSAGEDDRPIIDLQYYSGPGGLIDLEVTAHCVRYGEKIAQTEPLSKILLKQVSPDPETTSSDVDLQKWVQDNTGTCWHPIGTCAMGGKKGIEGGVVDERLRVYGVKGLRVVDASVFPLQISAHLQATVYAVAEKAADMVKEDTA